MEADSEVELDPSAGVGAGTAASGVAADGSSSLAAGS
jgi:hypothetical protein